MHKEFAVDPGVVTSWERLQMLTNCIGFDKGRVIVGCPNKVDWYRSVLVACKKDGDRMNRAVEVLARLIFDKRAVVNKEIPGWDEVQEWLINVVKADENLRGTLCDGIVTHRADSERAKILGFDTLDDENPRWRCESGRIPRVSEEIVKAARVLLHYSSEIIFVDPYMNPYREPSAKPLRGLLQAVFSAPARLKSNRYPVTRLECHVSCETNHHQYRNAASVRSLYSDKFSRVIPADYSLVVKRWRPRKDKMHARYILTDLGGIAYDHGLDEGSGTTDVQILGEPLRKQRWDDYVVSPALVLADAEPIVIRGQGRRLGCIGSSS